MTRLSLKILAIQPANPEAGEDSAEHQWLGGSDRSRPDLGPDTEEAAHREVEHGAWPVSQCRGGGLPPGGRRQLARDLQQVRIRVSRVDW